MTAVAQPRTAADPTAETGDRFVGTALLVLASILVVTQLIAGTIIPPVAVPALIYAVLGALLLRRRTRGLLIAAAVLPVLQIAGSAPFVAAALAHPETPGSFLPEAFSIAAAGTVVAGAVAALRRRTESRRMIAIVAAGLALTAAGASLVAANGVDAATRQPGDVAVTAAGASYPERVDVPAGGASLWLENADLFRHTFVVEGANVHVELPGASTASVTVDLATGTYPFFCDVPGHENMKGELVVR